MKTLQGPVALLILVTSTSTVGAEEFDASMEFDAGVADSDASAQGPSPFDSYVTTGFEDGDAGPESVEPAHLFEGEYGGVSQLPNSTLLDPDFPDAGDQGPGTGTCLAFATAYDIKSFLEEEKSHLPVDSNERIFSPGFLYNKLKPGNCRPDLNIYDALNALQTYGVLPLSEFAYDPNSCTRTPSLDEIRRAARYKIDGYFSATERWIGRWDVGEWKRYLASRHPILIGVKIPANFGTDAQGRVVSLSNGTTPHAMVVTGYDDTKGFRVLNSFGARWGDHGYFWIDYNELVGHTDHAFVLVDHRENDGSPPGLAVDQGKVFPTTVPEAFSAPIITPVMRFEGRRVIGIRGDLRLRKFGTTPARVLLYSFAGVRPIPDQLPGPEAAVVIAQIATAESVQFNALIDLDSISASTVTSGVIPVALSVEANGQIVSSKLYGLRVSE